jgi:hypothetical protein
MVPKITVVRGPVVRTAVRWAITTPALRMVARLEESLMAVVRLTRAALLGERPIQEDLLGEHRIPVALVAVARRIRAGTPAVDILRRPAVVAIRAAERPGLRRTTVVVANTSLRGIAEASQG